MRATPTPATSQSGLRAQIATLERIQRSRIEMVAEQKRQMDEHISKCDREIENLKAQLTMGVVRDE